jgi:hypothetical protein
MKDALGAVKVGHTYDLPMRLHQLRYQIARDRRPLKLVRAVEVPRGIMQTVERAVHRRLAYCNIHFEWFRTTPSVASRALNEVWNVAKALPEGFTTARAYKLFGKRL